MTKSWPTNSEDLRAMARIATAKQAGRKLCSPQQCKSWGWHAHGQLDDVLGDMRCCGLNYEEDMDTSLEAPGDCTTVDQLADYTWIIQKANLELKYAVWIQIVPTLKGALRQKFALTTERVAILEEEKEEAELEERNEIEDQGQPELRR